MNISRFEDDRSIDNTERKFTRKRLTPAYAATIALKTDVDRLLVQPATLTGAVTFTINVGDSTHEPFIGQEVEFLLQSDGTTRTATFGSGFAPNGTLAATTAKYAYIKFIFNGTAWQEVCRTVTA